MYKYIYSYKYPHVQVLCIGSSVAELDEIRSEMINATMCSEPSDLCYLQECKMCPGSNGIKFHVLKLQDIECMG